MDIIVRVVWEGKTYDLDIDSNIPLRLDISAVENGDIGKFFGVGSQKFNLPGTKNNNRFFKHSYEVGTEDIPAFYNSIKGYIIYNGETLVDGQFQLLETITDNNGYVSYSCQITDTVVQFKDNISNKLIKNGDWSNYTHTLTKENIVNSWDNSLLSGSVVYPIVDYGIDNSNDFPTIPRVSLSDSFGYIKNIQTPLNLKQFQPAIKVKDALQVIFNQVGYRFTGSFLEKDYIDDLYILSKPKEELGVGSGIDNTMSTRMLSNQTIGNVSSTDLVSSGIVEFNSIIEDNGDNFDTITYGYTTPITGKYEFGSQIYFVNPATELSDVDVKLQVWALGTVQYQVSQSLTYQSPDFITMNLDYKPDINFAAGVEVQTRVSMVHTGGGGSSDDLVILASNNYYDVNVAPTSFDGVEVNMADQWDSQTKSIDILNGLIEQFNLVITPEYGVNNSIQIDTFDDWIRSGRNKDWTDKWNTAIRKSINHTIDEQPKELLLQNVNDNDRFSKLALESEPNFQWGTLRLLADNNISQGEKKIGKYFGPVVMGSQITGSVDVDGSSTFNLDIGSNFIFPHLYKFDNRQQKSFKFKPRIGFFVNNELPTNEFFHLGTSQEDYLTVSGSYGTLSNVNELPTTENTFNLHFNTDYTSLIPTSYNENNSTSNFDTYWKTYLDSLYWEGSRKLVLDVEFKKEEYKDIRLNDIIFIKDQRYRINKISGFNVTNDDVVTVELIRLYPAYYNNETIIDLDCGFDFNGLLITPTPTPTPTATPTATPTPTPSPTPTATPVAFSATGGTTGSFTSGGVDYTYHEFANTSRTTTETFTLTSLGGSTTEARVIVVAGGAGGGINFSGNGDLGGGGGGGEVIVSSSISLSYPNNYSIQVGKGGAAQEYPGTPIDKDGNRGDDSTFSGSGVSILAHAGFGGIGSFDYDGGSSWLYLYGDGNSNNGGGGAGAAENGQNADSTNGGDGGNGLSVNLGYPVSPNLGNDFSANNYLLGAGGGGSSIYEFDRGIGGDQNGGDGRDSRLATDGGRHYGAGGGGGEVQLSGPWRGSAGGDGIVIVIYPTN